MEGKEVRFGVASSVLFAAVSTASSDGAVDCHARQLPASGWSRALGQHDGRRGVIIGAPGSGLYGMVPFCLVTVFVAPGS
jgi:potassium-transporting ATPase potassium-binding subunit